MAADTLDDLLVEQLRDLLDAETQITRALPKMSKAAVSPQLRSAFREHLRETEGHLKRLNEVFVQLGQTPKSKKCEAIRGLLAEGDSLLKEFEQGPVRDAALIAAAQKVEHYEMATYGTLRTFASLLGQEVAASLLEETLSEEKNADQNLTAIAERIVNLQAADEEGDEENEEEGFASQAARTVGSAAASAMRMARDAGRSIGLSGSARRSAQSRSSRPASASSSGRRKSSKSLAAKSSSRRGGRKK